MNSGKAKSSDIINFIYEIWYDNNEIKQETIIKSFKSARITDDFEKSESKRNFKLPVEVFPKIELKNYLDINLKNNSDNHSNFEKIKDDYADNNASEDLQPCIDEIFPKIQK